MNKYLLTIPCYNCENQISRVIKDLENFQYLSRIEKILFVDNQSVDSTVFVIKKLLINSKINNLSKILVNEKNYGLGGSQKVGFLYASQNNIAYNIILHGDDQAHTPDLALIINILDQDKNIDAVLGSRFSLNSNLIGYQKKRIIGNLILNFFYTLVTCKFTTDLGSGLNAYKTSTANQLGYLSFSNEFIFNTQFLLELYSKRSKLKFIAITWKEFDQISNAKNFKVAWAMTKLLFYWKINKKLIDTTFSDFKSKEV